MAQTMTPSKSMTKGQIDQLLERFGLALKKAASDLQSDPAQLVLEHQSVAFVDECVASFRKRVEANVEAKAKEIVRRVKVNRTRSPQEALVATGRRLFVNDDVAKSMPKGVGEEVEVVFFTLGRYVSVSDLEQEYEKRGLKPADAYSLAAANEADPSFADEKPNGTQWKDDKGNYCYAAFDRWLDERSVNVNRRDHVWDGFWWFAGLRK